MAFRSQFTKLMQKDMYGYFLESYDQLQPVYPQIFDVIQSNSAFEQSTNALGLGQPSERKEGDPIVASSPLEGWTVVAKNRTFSDGFYLTMEFVEDTPKEKIANIIRAFASTWGEGVTNAKETFAANIFNNGGLTAGHDIFNGTITGVVSDPSGDLLYDSAPFFNLSGNTRTAKDGSTYYNGLALSLSDTNLQTAHQLMTNTNNYNERGEKIALRPNILLHPSALTFSAKKILETDRAIGNANNDINVVQNIVTPIEWQYLTSASAWFLGAAKKGIHFLERKAPVIDFYQDEDDKKYYATIDTRFGVMVDNWRYWVGSNFSTS